MDDSVYWSYDLNPLIYNWNVLNALDTGWYRSYDIEKIFGQIIDVNINEDRISWLFTDIFWFSKIFSFFAKSWLVSN